MNESGVTIDWERFEVINKERQALVLKQFEENLSISEVERLESLRKELDDMEMEQMAPGLEKLEKFVKVHEYLIGMIKRYQELVKKPYLKRKEKWKRLHSDNRRQRR